MAINWIAYFFHETKLAGSDLIVALAIADNANPDGYARPGMQLLAQKTRLDVRQVRRVIRRLEGSGYLSTKFAPGRGHLPEFWLNRPEEKRTPTPAFNGTEKRTPTPAFKEIKADKSCRESGQIVSKKRSHIRNEPKEPLKINQLIDAVSVEKPETDRRIIAIGILQTLLRRTDLQDPGPIRSLAYFDPEIQTIEQQSNGLKGGTLDGLLQRRTEQYNSLVNSEA